MVQVLLPNQIIMLRFVVECILQKIVKSIFYFGSIENEENISVIFNFIDSGIFAEVY